jgi:hypothetical protein
MAELARGCSHSNSEPVHAARRISRALTPLPWHVLIDADKPDERGRARRGGGPGSVFSAPRCREFEGTRRAPRSEPARAARTHGKPAVVLQRDCAPAPEAKVKLADTTGKGVCEKAAAAATEKPDENAPAAQAPKPAEPQKECGSTAVEAAAVAEVNGKDVCEEEATAEKPAENAPAAPAAPATPAAPAAPKPAEPQKERGSTAAKAAAAAEVNGKDVCEEEGTAEKPAENAPVAPKPAKAAEPAVSSMERTSVATAAAAAAAAKPAKKSDSPSTATALPPAELPQREHELLFDSWAGGQVVEVRTFSFGAQPEPVPPKNGPQIMWCAIGVGAHRINSGDRITFKQTEPVQMRDR